MAGGRDAVDRITAQWDHVRPDLDVSPMSIIGRVSRLEKLIAQHLSDNFARHGLERWSFDVLATLYRSGEPHQLTAGELVHHSMVTTGAITNRIDRLEERGWVERARTDDRRKVLVRLTPSGKALVDEALETHLATERELLSCLSDRQRQQLASRLRSLLVDLGDHAEA